jgi:hypothetical protein
LFFPFSTLNDALPDLHPFGSPTVGSKASQEALDAWLADLARTVHTRAAVARGLVGFEVSGEPPAIPGPPAERKVGYLFPDGERLDWFPANVFAPD